MDIFQELGIDMKDSGTVATIETYSQLRQVVQKLVELRKKRGMTQNDVAKELMVSRQAVAKIEDPNSNPKISTLIGYAIAVDAHINLEVVENQVQTPAFSITTTARLAGRSTTRWGKVSNKTTSFEWAGAR